MQCIGVRSFLGVLPKSQRQGFREGEAPDELTNRKDVVITQNDEQESFRRQSREKTLQLTVSTTALYDVFSSRIDAALGAVGKKSALGKQIARIRADLRRNARSNGNGNGGSSSNSSPNS